MTTEEILQEHKGNKMKASQVFANVLMESDDPVYTRDEAINAAAQAYELARCVVEEMVL